MRRSSWPRFAAEAAFLILVAVGAAILRLERGAIVAVMAVAYLAVVAVEWTASRRARAAASPPGPEPTRASRRAGRRAVASGRLSPRHVRVLDDEAATPPADSAAPAPDGAPPPLAEDLPVEEPVSPEAPVSREESVSHEEPASHEEEAWSAEPPAAAGEAPGEAGTADLEPEAGAAEAVDLAPPEPEPPPSLEPAPEEPPREWNLWELERAARAAAGDDTARDEERAFLLVYLREFAGPDGMLPVDFDELVRDSFGDLVGVLPR